MPLSCYVPSQIIPKSRIVHLAYKQILKRHIMSYPKIIVSKNPPGVGGGGGGGGEGFDIWPMDYLKMCCTGGPQSSPAREALTGFFHSCYGF